MSKTEHQDPADPCPPVVYLVDDDETFREWVARALASAGLLTRCFDRPSAFLEDFTPDDAGCVILDVRLPEMSGPELYQVILNRGLRTPVMMITAYGEVPDAVAAIKAGAVDYVQKPISEQSLVERVQRAIGLWRESKNSHSEYLTTRDQIDSLSPRERQVLDLLLDGMNTKQMSNTLGIGLTTVDFHRHNIFDKMRVENAVELVNMMSRFNQYDRA